MARLNLIARTTNKLPELQSLQILRVKANTASSCMT